MIAGGLVVEDATVRIGKATLLDGVSFAVPPGTMCAVAGPNGAGKTTLLHLVLGLLPPAAGSVRFGGADLLAMPRAARARQAALVEQAARTDLPYSVRDVVMLGRIPHRSSAAADEAATDAALAAVGLFAFADRPYRTLSGGEQQRVQIARALAQQPALLVLDEPTSHLDLGAQLATLALLRRQAQAGATVFAAIHDLTLAAGCFERVLLLKAGKAIAFGDARQTLTAERIRDTYGVAVTLVADPHTGRPIVVPDVDAGAW